MHRHPWKFIPVVYFQATIIPGDNFQATIIINVEIIQESHMFVMLGHCRIGKGLECV